ncbi:hypothetical protein ACHAXT_009128 [Thalassiosira profunda]
MNNHIMDGADMRSHLERFRPYRTGPHSAPNIQRILLLSDLHMDYPQNQEWLHKMCTTDSGAGDAADAHTMIVVAGDVSHDLEILQWTFQLLKRKFGEVAFTVGNHELWIDKPRKAKVATTLDADDDVGVYCKTTGKGDGCETSIDKLEKILQLCMEEGVRIGPVGVGSDGNNGAPSLWVLPLLSWHHHSFDTEPAVEGWGGIPSARKVVGDYRKTVWPPPLSALDDSVAEFLDGVNDVLLDLDGMDTKDAPLLTFSHFLPRIELLPEKRYLTLPTLHSCVGSTFLEARLRKLGKGIGSIEGRIEHHHAFGHTHLSWDATIDGIRYMHVPLAYPREWEQRRRSLEIGSMRGEESDRRYPVCIWQDATATTSESANADNNEENRTASTGFPSQWLGGWWSKYYAVMPRQPHRNNLLAPWAARRYRQLPGGEIEDFDHAEVERRHRLQCPENDWTTGTGNWYDAARVAGPSKTDAAKSS